MRILKGLGLILSLLLVSAAYATGNQGIGQIATNITQSFTAIGHLMIAVAYLAGIGFAIAAIFKFKQHKDNPTQIPMGTPIALLVIGVFLVFIANFFTPAGATLFGSTNVKAGGFQGQGASVLPGDQGGQ